MSTEAILLSLRISARISCLLFLAAFAGSGLRRLWPSNWTAWVDKSRPMFLLLFAGSHSVHLALIFALARAMSDQFSKRFPLYVLIAGGALFALIYGLAVAAYFDWRSRGMMRIPVLHSPVFQGIAMYLLWLVFALAFVTGTFRHPETYVFFGLAVVSALVLRIIGRVSAVRIEKAAAGG
jgi:methionine sulfoxide reductase heme-binding subunit